MTQRLLFEVSRDGEHAQIFLIEGRVRTPLGNRAFDYMLLQLARARLADAARGETAKWDHGWMHTGDLAHVIGLNVQHLNVNVHRARRSFEAAGLSFETIIERRPRAQEIRLGLSKVRIDEPF